MSSEKLLDIMNNLCNMFINDGTVPEEVIEMMIDAGADVAVLKKIGFSDSQIEDYVYYESMMSGRSEAEIFAELQGGPN